MKFIADIHIHSHFSRATSKDLNFEHLTKWAQLKGVQVVGSGDITHPGWLQEMKEKLEPAEEGLFRLKDEFTNVMQREVPDACQGTVRLILTHAKTRFLFGQRCENEPSRFLSDIENALIEFKKTTPRKPVNKRKDDQQLQLFKGTNPEDSGLTRHQQEHQNH